MGKEPLILLPGTLCDHRLWGHQVQHLADIADISIGDITKDDTIKGMAKSILANAPEKFALAGLSLGGIVAMEVVHQAPERVTNLALLDSNPNGPKPEQIEAWEKFNVMVDEGRFSEITEKFLLPNLIHKNRLADKRLIATICDMAEKVGPEAYKRQLKAVASRSDATDKLKRIQCPTLLLVGREDAVCPVEFHKQMSFLIPNSKLAVVEDCGHLSSMEQPAIITLYLRQWLLEVNSFERQGENEIEK
ncbi:alpha/beta fold hydrolase [Cytobacillus oceanisediminis]|uniref:alpha/beta fold hydrolase n=1 Tax=Cytobacillus oceanisediminis TaxID=665099 RepID=UPI0037365BF4